MIQQVSRFLKGVILGFGIAYTTNNDETRRTVKLWTSIGPVIAHYRIVEFKQAHFGPRPRSPAAEAEWEKLHQKYSGHVFETIQELRGYYEKIGQVLASRNDFMPQSYIEKFRSLEDQAPRSTDPRIIEDILKAELGLTNLEEVFEEFSLEKPLGTASFGHVFRARLKDESRADIVLKVQIPGVEQLYRSDVKTIQSFCRFFAPNQVRLFDEIERHFLSEFDYRKEARHLAQIHQNMKRFKDVVVPKPWLKYCTKAVLVMDYLPGPKLIDGIRMQGREWAKNEGIDYDQLQKDIMDKYEKEGLPPPYPAKNVRILDMYRRFTTIQEHLLNSALCVYNVLVHLINFMSFGRISIPSLPYYDFSIQLNSARIISTLLNVHGHQILVDGYFNSDPRAGNFLLLPDGRIGLIDYGHVKRYTKAERLELAKIIATMYKNDNKHIPNWEIANGCKSKYFDPHVISKMTLLVLHRDARTVTLGVSAQQSFDKTGDLLAIPSRVSFLLSNIGLMINNPVSVLQVWGPIAEKVLNSKGILN